MALNLCIPVTLNCISTIKQCFKKYTDTDCLLVGDSVQTLQNRSQSRISWISMALTEIIYFFIRFRKDLLAWISDGRVTDEF